MSNKQLSRLANTKNQNKEEDKMKRAPKLQFLCNQVVLLSYRLFQNDIKANDKPPKRENKLRHHQGKHKKLIDESTLHPKAL